jgi:SAM-dependent methyltransferase
MRQVRKPTRWVGRFFVWTMNQSHSALTDWGLEHVEIEPAFAILDVGCGGGRTIQKLAQAASAGRVAGIDYALGSVEGSRATNAEAIRARRVEIRQASVSQLPFAASTFDLVTAVETHYYWPDLPADLREVLRVTKPGGACIVIAEAYKGARMDLVQRPAMALLRAKLMSAAEHRRWFEDAGFVQVQVFEERAHGWICVTGRKPAGPA